MARLSPNAHAGEHKGAKKRGNDGNLWISVKDKNGVYRWKPHVEDIVVKNAVVYRGWAEIPNALICLTTQNSQVGKELKVTLRSKMITAANEEFTMSIKRIKREDDLLAFKHKKQCYNVMMWKTPAAIKKTVMKLVPETGVTFNDMCHDSHDITKDTYYGDLTLLTTARMKRLKKGEKYYIAWGQRYHTDYDTTDISVLEFIGYKKIGDDIFLYGKVYTKDKIWDESGKSDDFSALSIHEGNKFVTTGSGDDPVHLVTKLNKNIKLPKKLPRAKVFK